MPGLSAPPDYTNVYKLIALGIICIGIVVAIRSNTLPHAGDTQHALPHGGLYRDGTKQVTYYPASQSAQTHNNAYAAAAVLIISFLIWISTKLSAHSSPRSPPVCAHCPRH